MKFARYLQDTQTPEWKKAYIDYRGLKKRISACRRFQEEQQQTSPSSSLTHLPSSKKAYDEELEQPSTSRMRHDAGMGLSELPEPRDQGHANQGGNSSGSLGRVKSNNGGRKRSHTTRSILARAGSTIRQTTQPFGRPLPLNELRPLLSDVEVAFFNALDKELEKVESFYSNREKEMQNRTRLLQTQLQELSTHRQRYHDAQGKSGTWSSALKPAFALNLGSRLYYHGKRQEKPVLNNKESSDRHNLPVSNIGDKEKRISSVESSTFSPGDGQERQHLPPRALDPDEYQRAKRTLKKAVLEHYRGLEMLHNYRVLNITGFRKALKKFEKVTRIPALDAYMTEKVETSAFSSDKSLRTMMSDMVALYAAHFVHGDEKRARKRLRAGTFYKTHHFSTFRSGLLLGIALPALISGIYQSFQADTRENIPGWDGLLFFYSIFLIPVVFSLLVGLNLSVWANSRINYIFIFELEPRTRLDHREYFEIPSLLFATLCYAFWLSFSRIGAPSISPNIWPLVWLGFTALVMFDPLQINFKESRYWLIRRIGKLLVPGATRVEFADFWMGDQFCSLVFTLSNLSQFVCSYVRGFENWRQCGATSSIWPVAFALALLPFLIRLIQSIRRYADTRLVTHLINGGKYATGVVYYLCYYIWRHQGGRLHGASFAVWVLFGILYSSYASAWDFWMDWSVLRPHVKYPLLREELIYSNLIPSYYFAIISNVIIRFTWIIYIPTRGPDSYTRLFIQAFLEMLRRWQWNFYRLENEHLGNMDQYRVTREVPLPYSFNSEDTSHDDDDHNDEDEE
ncbi:Xenotropic and polytropic retrovirus receptor 1 [Stygiomarasmius scandens]|uniref:Xenotropic and polytropic retrovirus receptor 1 n=1 Tax=Marasmiellus scandens TaxID=2682957 RepID=A0ABR1JKK2_9AGAR